MRLPWVYGMKMTLGKRTIVAHIQERDEARQHYENAKQQGRSASLLEQQRPNVFQMNVANMLPGDDIQVELSYTELLIPTGGAYEFAFPTVVGPRYSNTPASKATETERWVANPYTAQGVAPKSTFHMEVRLSAGMPIAKMACATHQNVLSFEGAGQATLRLSPEEKHSGNRDFILHYQLANQQLQSGLMLYEGKDENFFLLTVQPPKRIAPNHLPGREYVFILDVSGSMHGYPLETSKALIKNLIASLKPSDCFNILLFESDSSLWSACSKPATHENLHSALAFVEKTIGGGGTEIVSAMKRALVLPKREGFSRTFVVATDGYISAEPQVLDVVRDNLGQANLFAFGIGSAVNRYLIEGMAHAGMGEPFIVTKAEEAADQAEKFRQYISQPALTQVQVRFTNFDAYDVEPAKCPDVLAERPVLCFGKWRGKAQGYVQVTGVSGKGRFEQRFHVADARPQTAHSALRYLWARHRLQGLSDYAAFGGGNASSQAILDLGLRYGLLTARTSFVAIDSEVRHQGNQPVQVKQPLPLPEGVSPLAIGGNAYAACPSMDCQGVPPCAVRHMKMSSPKRKEECLQRPLRAPSHPLLRIAQISADQPTVATDHVQGHLQTRLAEPPLTTLLHHMPTGCTLTLKVNAAGHVMHAAFSHPFPGQKEAIQAILRWKVSPWPGVKSTLTITFTL